MMMKWLNWTNSIRSRVRTLRNLIYVEKKEKGGDEDLDDDALLAELGEMVKFGCFIEVQAAEEGYVDNEDPTARAKEL